jgi:hypothetical protein
VNVPGWVVEVVDIVKKECVGLGEGLRMKKGKSYKRLIQAK